MGFDYSDELIPSLSTFLPWTQQFDHFVAQALNFVALGSKLLSAARKKISFSSLLPYWDSLRGDPRFEKSSPISRRRRQLPDNAAALNFFPLQSSNIVSRLRYMKPGR